MYGDHRDLHVLTPLSLHDALPISGIGERLSEEGAWVVFTGRAADTGVALETELRAKGLEVTFMQGSIIEEADVAAAVAATVEKYGSLTTLVNNAAATDVTGDRERLV